MWKSSLRSSAGPDFETGYELQGCLHMAADDMQRLWRATKPVRQYNEDAESMATECPACGWWWRDDEDEQHYSDCPREALRPLFGEMAE